MCVLPCENLSVPEKLPAANHVRRCRTSTYDFRAEKCLCGAYVHVGGGI
jgi:hypothetical protein